jgi:hypothetical protein
MHEFYRRAEKVFKLAHSNRRQFCKAQGINYHTLQTYWNTDRLPPGRVLEALAIEYRVSIDALVFGAEAPWASRIPSQVQTDDSDWAELEELDAPD